MDKIQQLTWCKHEIINADWPLLSNFVLIHMIAFSNFEIKEMFWWNNFFLFLFFVIKCITLLGKSTVLLPFDLKNCLFYFYTQFSQLIIFNWLKTSNLKLVENKNSIKMQRNSLKSYKSNLFINVSLLLLCRKNPKVAKDFLKKKILQKNRFLCITPNSH